MSFIHSYYNNQYEPTDDNIVINNLFKFLPLIIMCVVAVIIIVYVVSFEINKQRIKKLKEMKKNDDDMLNNYIPIILNRVDETINKMENIKQLPYKKLEQDNKNEMKQTIVIKQYDITQNNKGELNIKEMTNIKSNISDGQFNNLVENIVNKNDILNVNDKK